VYCGWASPLIRFGGAVEQEKHLASFTQQVLETAFCQKETAAILARIRSEIESNSNQGEDGTR